mmetsp:Transcript_21474/g.32770  ORF Transcript_21474/g.32770 Transcript_21474/m.32770 type:complete len:414 (+) Transcript_21474:22-1263(+)
MMRNRARNRVGAQQDPSPVIARPSNKSTRNGIWRIALTIVFLIVGLVFLSGLKQQDETLAATSILSVEEHQHTQPAIVTKRGAKTSPLTTKDCRDKVPAAHGFEIIMESMMGSLFREEGFLNEVGSVLDVGAQFGEQACHYAVLAPERTVYALDPSPRNTQKIKRAFSVLQNLVVWTMGIGEAAGTVSVTQNGFEMPIGSTFEVKTMDDIFFHNNESIAFAHIDVEGVELGVLRGGRKSIEAYSPIFTIEVRVYEDEQYTRQLVQFIYELGYDAYLVNEVCGIRMDFRNILAFPRKRSKVLEYSDTFNLLMAGNLVVRVDPESIFDWVYPCCKLGGECCPSGDPNGKECCMQKMVELWLKRKNIKLHPQLSTFVGSRRSTQRQWYRLGTRVSMDPATAKSNANWINESPFKSS